MKIIKTIAFLKNVPTYGVNALRLPFRSIKYLKGSIIVGSNLVAGNRVASLDGDRYYNSDLTKIKYLGGELIFFDEKSDMVILQASSMNNALFQMTVTTEVYGGISKIEFSFSHAGSTIGLAESKVLCRIKGKSIGYATLSGYTYDIGILTGVCFSVWGELQDFKPNDNDVAYNEELGIEEIDNTFYLNQASMPPGEQLTIQRAIVAYNEYVIKQANDNKLFWPCKYVFLDKNLKDFPIDNIDNYNNSIRDFLDKVISLIDGCYEIYDDTLVIYPKTEVFVNEIYGFNLEMTFDKIINHVKLYVDDSDNDHIYVGEARDESSIERYGLYKTDVTIPFYLDADQRLYIDNFLEPNPKWTGEFKFKMSNKVRFFKYIVPFKTNSHVVSDCMTVKDWTGGNLVDGHHKVHAIMVLGSARYNANMPIKNLSIEAKGQCTANLYTNNDELIKSIRLSSDKYVVLSFFVGDYVTHIDFNGDVTVNQMHTNTNATSWIDIFPDEIEYNVIGFNAEVVVRASDGISLVDQIENISDNSKLVNDYLSNMEVNK